jgi:hypothetical protein
MIGGRGGIPRAAGVQRAHGRARWRGSGARSPRMSTAGAVSTNPAQPPARWRGPGARSPSESTAGAANTTLDRRAPHRYDVLYSGSVGSAAGERRVRCPRL